MKGLEKVIADALAVSREENRAGELSLVGRQVRAMFNKVLGGTDVFGTDRDWSGGLLKTVVDRYGISVLYHVGGTLRMIDTSNGRMQYEIVGGAGRAFRFMAHPEHEPLCRQDFFAPGFSYVQQALALSKVVGGTVARVRAATQSVFSIDAINRITADGIEDLRIYHCGGELVDKTRALFEETISSKKGEWDRIFRLLNT